MIEALGDGDGGQGERLPLFAHLVKSNDEQSLLQTENVILKYQI